MKKIKLLTFLAFAFKDNGQAMLYTAQNPERTINQNMHTNPIGSQYGATYGHNTSSLLTRVVRQIIYDAAPQQYFDLKILGMKTPEQVNSDEFYFHEMGFGRDPIIVDTLGANIAAGVTQSIPITNKASVSLDMLVTYENNQRGTITNIVEAGDGATITVTAMSGETLPLIPAGASGTTVLANLSPVEADGANSISQYMRFPTIERFNYVQMVIKAMRFGTIELIKYQKTGQLTNYLAMQKKRMYQQFRISLANIYWNGQKGQVTLANGQKAKTAEGVFPAMQRAGSANTTVSLANLPSALEELALNTEYGVYGKKRFLYAAPRTIHYLSQQYKRQLTRYTPDDYVAKLGLTGVDIGSTNIVFVPVKRFEEPSCFPRSWRARALLLDQESITPKYIVPEEMGETLSRVNQGNLQNYVDSWISNTFSIQYDNPLGGGWLDINDLP